MSKEKPDQVIEGEVSLTDLQNSIFSFGVGQVQPVEGQDDLQISTSTPAKPKEEEEEEIVEDPKKKETPPAPADAASEEEEEEIAEEEEEEEEDDTKKEVPAQSGFSFKNVASKYLDEGIWQDMELELEEGKTVKLSEVDSIDEDTFFAIQKAQGEYSSEEVQEKYISKDGLSEDALKIVDILKNGGEFTELFENPQQAKRPFEGVDIESEQNQQAILYEQYVRQGLGDKEAKELVKIATKDLTLDAKVQEIVTHYNKAYDTYLDNKQKEQAQKKLEADKKTREFKKNVMASLKEGFQLKDTLARKLTNLGVEKTATGDFKIDEIYEQKMEDPQEAAELLYFLSDKEGYLNMMGAKTKRKENIKTMKKLSILKDKVKKEGGKVEKPTSAPGLKFKVGA